MRHDIENPMVIDSLWAEREQDHRTIIGECAGCEEDIYSSELWLDMELKGQQYLVHQDKECTYSFVADLSICRGGEEE